MRAATILLITALLLAGCGSGTPSRPRQSPEAAAEEKRLDQTFGATKAETETSTVRYTVTLPKTPPAPKR